MFLICENCNWEIIPMIVGAWLLGFLFWMFFFKKRHSKEVEKLSTKLEQYEILIEKNKRDFEATVYKNQKLTNEINVHSKTIKSLEVKIQQLEKGN